ncbi:CHAT domain-containing protein [Streptomyces sp. NPDC052101]|uniref:CHAT domain-containing protein n=1 Tax=Streptomyces sp. NPDC052101 TaxID=3155763 RepID=UPI0034384660
MVEAVSHAQYVEIDCAQCGESFSPELYVLVDADERPDLVRLIRQDILHCPVCPHCHVVMAVGLPLLVHRPGQRVPVIYSPVPQAGPQVRQLHGEMLVQLLCERLGSRWTDSLARHVYTAERAELGSLVDLDLDLLPGGRDTSLREAMERYQFSTTWEEARAAVEGFDLLVGPEAEYVLRNGIRNAEAAGDAEAAATTAQHLDVLLDCRGRGVPAAFADLCDGTGRTVKTSLVAVYHALAESAGDDPHSRLPLLRAALEWERREDDDERWAHLQLELADALAGLALTGRTSRTDDPAWHYRSALDVLTARRAPREWVAASLRLLRTVRLTPSFPTGPQLALAILCHAQPQDRTRSTLTEVLPDVWDEVKGDTEPPAVVDVVQALVDDGMLRVGADGEACEVPDWVLASLSAGLSPSTGMIVDSSLAEHRLARLSSPGTGTAGGPPGAEVRHTLATAVPYLARAQDWERLHPVLQTLAAVDGSPATLDLVQDHHRVMAETTGSTESRAELGRVLMSSRPVEAAVLLRAALEEYRAAGASAQALRVGFNLAGALRRTGRVGEAFVLHAELTRLAADLDGGRWTELALEVRGLEIQHSLGRRQDVLDGVRALRDRIADWPEQEPDRGDAIAPHEVREALLALGESAAGELERWGEALSFSDARIACMRQRGASPQELATAHHNRYIPLLNLGELDAAETILLYCREEYDKSGSPSDLAAVYGALGEIAQRRGRAAEAVALQRQTLHHAHQGPTPHLVATAHRHYAEYLPAEEAEARLAHALLAALLYRTVGSESRFRQTIGQIAERRHTPELITGADRTWLASVVARVDGLDLTRLAADLRLDAADIDSGLAQILTIVGETDPATGGHRDTLVRRWEPVVAAVVAVVHGDQDASAALDEYLALRELAPEWAKLVASLRLVLDGRRDAAALSDGLDDIDTAVVRRTLDALAERVRLASGATELAASTADARRRHEGVLDTMSGAARGIRHARREADDWLEMITTKVGQPELARAVSAVLAGTREPELPLDGLTPAQLWLVAAITEAVDAQQPVGTVEDDPGGYLYELLSDPVGPSHDDMGVIVRNESGLAQACTAVEEGVRRRLTAGDTPGAAHILNAVVGVLLLRHDHRRALPLAELLAEAAEQDPSAALEAEVVELVCRTTVDVARGAGADSVLALVGTAVPSHSPAPLGIGPAPGLVDRARRWLGVARTLRRGVPDSAMERQLMLAEVVVNQAAGDSERTVALVRAVLDSPDTTQADPAYAATLRVLLADAHTRRGDLQTAVQIYDGLLADGFPAEPADTAAVLIHRANVLALLGRHRQALAGVHRAQALLESNAGTGIGTTLARGSLLSQLGWLYELLGDLPAAATAYERGLCIARDSGHQIGQATLLKSLGTLLGKLSTGYVRALGAGELREVFAVLYRVDPQLMHLPTRQGARSAAVVLLRSAAGLFRAAHDEPGWARTTDALCNLMPADQDEEAVELLTEVLRVLENDRLAQAAPLANLAGRLRSLGRLDEAEEALRRSLEISRAAGYFDSATRSATSLGRLTHGQGRLEEAENAFRDAVSLIEAVRPHRPLDDRSRVSFVHGHQRAYEGLVDCLLARGAHEEAFDVVQQAKSRALLDLLALAEPAPHQEASGRFAELLAAEAEHLAVLRQSSRQPERAARAQEALHAVYEEMNGHDPDYVTMRRGTPADARSVRRWLAGQGRPVLLVEYFLGIDHLTVFFLRAEWETVRVAATRLTRADLTRAHADFRRQVVQYRNAAGSAWTALSQQVTEPMAEYLRPDDLVVLVPHGTLHALPLHALPVGGEPLASRNPVVHIPAAGLLPLCQSPGKGTGRLATCAAFGVTYEAEAAAVADLFGDTPVPAEGLNAEVVAARAADRDVVHFSCHARFDAADPLGSGLYLSPGDPSEDDEGADDSDDMLTVRHIMGMGFRHELVTVSACETGVQEALDGDELIGLTRAFLYAGARAVVASLWPVDADTTRDFMVRFYGHLRAACARGDALDKAGALRRAQLDTMRDKGVHASYHWAPFVLIGDGN